MQPSDEFPVHWDDPAETAREYRIPAVLAVDGATRLIRDGQLLEVESTRGTVRVL